MGIERQRKIQIFIQAFAFVFFILISPCSYAVLNSDKSPELSSDKLQRETLISKEDTKENKNDPSPIPLPQGEGVRGRVDDGFSDELNKQFKNALQLINTKSYKEAENILLSFEDHDLWLDKIYFLFGRLYKEQNFLDKAEDSFKKAAAHNYLLKDYAFKFLAHTYVVKKEYDKAVETLRQIQNKTLIQEAKQSEIASFLALKDEEAAARALYQYIKEYPAEWDYRLLLAQLFKKSERDKAISLFKEIYISASPFSADALKELKGMNAAKFTWEEEFRRAENLFKNGSFESAEDAYKKIFKSVKDSTLKDKIRFSIGTCQFKQKKYSEAAQNFELVKTPEAMYWGARAVYRIDDTSGFERIIKGLEKEYPGNQYIPKLLLLLADGKRRMGDLSEAEGIFKKVSNEFPEEAEDALWGLGWINYTHGNYKESEKIFSKLTSSKGNGRYLYWEAKSREMLYKDCMLKKTDSNMADNACPEIDTANAYSSLLKDTGYYGFLAKRYLKEFNTTDKSELTLGNESYRRTEIEPSEPLEREIRNNISRSKVPDGQIYEMIEMLKFLEMNKEAVDEIKAAVRSAKSLEELKYLGQSAFELNEYKSILYSVEGLANKEVLTLAYPLGFWNIVKQASEKENIDPYIIVALIREESRFDPDALSPAGAVGLMQLMPFTAQRFKRALKIELTNDSEIHDVKKNIFIGTHYFSLLIKEFEVLPLALASYNAGEHIIRRWLLNSKHKDMEEFIEDIPYQETRNYVKRVLRSYWQYRAMNGLPIY